MIIKDHPTWLHLVFSIKGTTLRTIWPRVLFVTVLAATVTLIYEFSIHPRVEKAAQVGDGKAAISTLSLYNISWQPFSLIGVAIAIFLGFRTNASYDRFWEGRKLWGRLVNVSRSFAREISMLVALPPRPDGDGASDDPPELVEFRREIFHRTIGYVHALRHHLRDSSPFDEDETARRLAADEVPHLSQQINVPAALMQTMGMRLKWAWQRGWIRDYHLALLENSLTEFTTIQGACERIKSTPIPFRYNVLTHRIVAIYCVFLPFGMVSDLHFVTPLAALFISICFFGIDDIGDEIEQPFGLRENHLPLHALSRMIETNLLQLTGEREAPQLLQPQDGVLC